MSRKRHLATAVCAAALSAAAVAQAAPADGLRLIDRPARTFDRSLEAGALSVRYELLAHRARQLGIGDRAGLAREDVRSVAELRAAIRELAAHVDSAAAAHREERQFAPEGGTIEGVSLATLEAIAACESGGDPTAVNAAGYYGKYQFDMGTWASVGGSGNPAEASEAEQDYRAALLYSRAGSSPWPVCGA